MRNPVFVYFIKEVAHVQNEPCEWFLSVSGLGWESCPACSARSAGCVSVEEHLQVVNWKVYKE